MLRVAPFLSLLGSVACGSEVVVPDSGPDGDPESELFTLVGDITDTQGFVLEAREVVDVERSSERTHLEGADFFLTVTKEVSFHGTGEDPLVFCDVGDGYDTASEITTDPVGCTWSNARLGANAPGACYIEAGQGYLMRAPDETIKRIRIVACDVDDGGVARVTFEIR